MFRKDSCGYYVKLKRYRTILMERLVNAGGWSFVVHDNTTSTPIEQTRANSGGW